MGASAKDDMLVNGQPTLELSGQTSRQEGDVLHVSGPDPVLIARMSLLQDVSRCLLVLATHSDLLRRLTKLDLPITIPSCFV